MNLIENLQKELCEYLISMMPVKWEKICFYSECNSGRCSAWFAFIEKKTGIICTQDFFWDRYNSYPISKMEAYLKLTDFVIALHNAYKDKFGPEKVWHTLSYTVTNDCKFHIDLGYEDKDVSVMRTHEEVFKNFFGVPYEYIEGKYPYWIHRRLFWFIEIIHGDLPHSV